MTAIRELALAAAKSVIDTLGVTAKRNPAIALDEDDDLPALIMFDGGHDRQKIFSGAAQYDLRFSVDIYVAESGGANIGTLINAQYAALVAALYASFRTGALNTYCADFEESGMSDPVLLQLEGKRLCAAASVEFGANIWTQESDVEQLGG